MVCQLRRVGYTLGQPLNLSGLKPQTFLFHSQCTSIMSQLGAVFRGVILTLELKLTEYLSLNAGS